MADTVGVKYGLPPPDVSGCEVIMVDFCYKQDTLKQMLERCYSISIYDHHASAKRELDGFEHPKLTKVVFDMNRSGAEIAWDEFCGDVERPKIVNLVEDYDLWHFKYPETKQVVEAIRGMPRTMETIDRIHAMCEDPMLLKTLIFIGDGILNFKQQMVEHSCNFAHDVEIVGEKVWATNVPYFLSSETAHKLIRDRKFGVTYYEDGDVWRFSLRSCGDYDVSKIAESYGGGGHKNASGFQVKKLPWL